MYFHIAFKQTSMIVCHFWLQILCYYWVKFKPVTFIKKHISKCNLVAYECTLQETVQYKCYRVFPLNQAYTYPYIICNFFTANELIEGVWTLDHLLNQNYALFAILPTSHVHLISVSPPNKGGPDVISYIFQAKVSEYCVVIYVVKKKENL